MTETTTAISVKLPAKLAERIPAAGKGRSRFVVQAIAEKLSRQSAPEWKPTTERGRRMAALLADGSKERMPLLNDEELEHELAKRRGRKF
jgi:post-segregation antitoxin (ccd killing protein)